MGLSEAARSVWAKSPNDDGWLPLWQHMDDSADVAGALLDRWLAPQVLRTLAVPFGGDLRQARVAVVFLAGIHDLGKATPAFAVQHELLAERMTALGLRVPPKVSDELRERRRAHHSVAGHHLLIRWLRAQGWTKPAARAWGVVLGGHHGVPPDSTVEQDSHPSAVGGLYGTGRWDAVQCELAERMAARSGADEFLPEWKELALTAQFQVLATAVVIVSDWIASNDELLPYLNGELPQEQDAPERVRNALHELGLPSPWSPGEPPEVEALFGARFVLPEGARPRPVQRVVCEVATAAAEPGLLVVEAPMGEGKTEAALAAAEIMAHRHGAGGLLVALPTQATTDAMFDRITAWLDAMGNAGVPVAGALALTHGKARFNRQYQGLMRAGRRPRQVGCDEDGHGVLPHGWLSGRKKAALANFQVATIDHLLFAGLKSRHLMLRHLGLAGKVVVLDEIHAYDAFMGSFLTKVLTWLGAYRVPVIALSATLPGDRRQALVDAYQRGAGAQDEAVSVAGEIGYPVVTWTDGASVSTKVAAASGRSTSVQLESLPDDIGSLTEILRDSLSEGGTALVVHNTVRRVLATAEQLAAEFPGEITVAHSRFITADRVRNDGALLDAFGPPRRAVERPYRRIVVASQVVEQSLDVDFDLLITDHAPVDLVLQRMGRLHRHDRGMRPGKVREARAYITGADFAQDPPGLEPGAERYVYGRYPLLRAAAVLRERFGKTVELPDDIAPLVQQAYVQDKVGPDAWQDDIDEARHDWLAEIDKRESKADNFQIRAPGKPGTAIIGWIHANVGDVGDEDSAEAQGYVRDGVPTLEALLVVADSAGEWRTPAWLPGGGGQLIPRDATPPDELAEVMAACGVRLPLQVSNADAEEALWEATPPAWEQSQLIFGLPALVIDEDGYGEVAGRPFRYTQPKGLEVFDRA